MDEFGQAASVINGRPLPPDAEDRTLRPPNAGFVSVRSGARLDCRRLPFTHMFSRLLRAQGFHGIEPEGAVRRRQARDQRNQGQRCRGPRKGQRI